jgi:hypothetical protein
MGLARPVGPSSTRTTGSPVAGRGPPPTESPTLDPTPAAATHLLTTITTEVSAAIPITGTGRSPRESAPNVPPSRTRQFLTRRPHLVPTADVTRPSHRVGPRACIGSSHTFRPGPSTSPGHVARFLARDRMRRACGGCVRCRSSPLTESGRSSTEPRDDSVSATVMGAQQARTSRRSLRRRRRCEDVSATRIVLGYLSHVHDHFARWAIRLPQRPV